VAFRDSPFQALKAPLTLTAAAVVIVAAVAALALFFSDHRTTTSQGPYGPVRGEFDELIEPVVGVLSAPVHWAGSVADYFSDYVGAIGQNHDLKRQVAELKHWRDAAIALKNLNLRYEALLKLKTEPPIAMVTARAVSDAHGPFSEARLLDAGSAAGIKVGNPAMGEDGVVGRIVGATTTVSRLLLLTDVESRTPVMVDRSNARAILTGDGGPNPKLEYVRGVDAVHDGDLVLTSGDGGVYPRGLPVGVAAQDFRGVWRVRLYSDRGAVDFVRVLLFDDFARAVSPKALAGDALPPLTPAEGAELSAVRAAALKPAPRPDAALGGPDAKPPSAGVPASTLKAPLKKDQPASAPVHSDRTPDGPTKNDAEAPP
jgi:rod shape-determining protein MreC